MVKLKILVREKLDPAAIEHVKSSMACLRLIFASPLATRLLPRHGSPPSSQREEASLSGRQTGEIEKEEREGGREGGEGGFDVVTASLFRSLFPRSSSVRNRGRGRTRTRTPRERAGEAEGTEEVKRGKQSSYETVCRVAAQEIERGRGREGRGGRKGGR